jgi:integrase
MINAASHADPPSKSESKPPELKAWTALELRQFLKLTKDDRYHWPWLFLATTGCRRGEALGLRWSDVDLDRKVLAIRQECIPLSKPAGPGREGRIIPRTKKDKPRVIDLDKRTIAALRKWPDLQAAERQLAGPGYDDQDLVFSKPAGRCYHPEAFSKTFDRRLRQPGFAELLTIRLHDLRHTWATLALIANVNVKLVSDRLGHSSTNVTWNTYQHVVKGMQADAAERVADLIFGDEEEESDETPRSERQDDPADPGRR